MERIHWQDAVTLLTGIGLVAAALFLEIPPPEGVSLAPAIWNFVLVGAAAVVVAVAAMYAFRQWEEGIELVLGIWLVASPWLLGFENIRTLMWLAVIGGGIIMVMALTVLLQPNAKNWF